MAHTTLTAASHIQVGQPRALRGCAAASMEEQLSAALSLVAQLTDSNLQSLRLAKQLMVAQDLAELRTGRAEWAIDCAADSGGDASAIDAAVEAVAAADRAEADERGLALAWAVHRIEVSRLAEIAQQWSVERSYRRS